MKNILPKGFSDFLKNPDMSKLVCVVIALFLAVLILRYYNVIEGMSDNITSEMMRNARGPGHSDGGGRGSHHRSGRGRGGRDDSDDTMKNMMNPTKLMSKIGM